MQASAAIDIITGASPQLVSNATGRPVQSITGASISDHRKTGDVKVTRRFDDFALSLSNALSKEHDYRSKAFGVEGRWDLNQRNTTLTAGYGRRTIACALPTITLLDEPRDTREYLAGVTQVLSPTQLVQSTLASRAARAGTTIPTRSRSLSIRRGSPSPRAIPGPTIATRSRGSRAIARIRPR